MIKILQVRNIDSFVESRRQKTSEKDRKIVQSILNDVRKNGDSAVKKYERKFNGRKTSQLRISEKEIKEAKSKISREERRALVTQISSVDREASLLGHGLDKAEEDYSQWWDEAKKHDNADPFVQQLFVPIPSVGCYIPGGQARYPSSAVMSIFPAVYAGVRRIVLVSPPGRDGKIDPLTIWAARR